jgi:hypothetical protein
MKTKDEKMAAVATIPFQHADLHAMDILGHIPSSKHPNSTSASLGTLCVFAVKNSSSSGIDFYFGKEPADTFTRDQHPDLRADFVMALPSAAARSLPRSHPADRPNGRINPPFNIKEWWDGKLEGDARWSRSEAESASHAQFYQNRGKYGTPPQTATRECAPLKSEGNPQVVSEARNKNANFTWVQHMVHHLAPNGSMALLLANGSMSSNSGGEGDISRALIEADLVETTMREGAPLKSEGIPQVISEARGNMVALPDRVAIDPINVTIAHQACVVPHSPSRKEIINAN